MLLRIIVNNLGIPSSRAGLNQICVYRLQGSICYAQRATEQFTQVNPSVHIRNAAKLISTRTTI